MSKLKVVELFAGVGGFRIGLERSNANFVDKAYEVVWSNQWEPSTKMQHASMVYEAKFGNEGHSNKDIATVEVSEIPNFDLLVGGFPCQDYSVATTLKNSKGIKGKKGVLWWEIYRILNDVATKPDYLFLENVDRLIKSPSTQRGKDFAVMLKCLDLLGYAVEWRVINAADYGMPQRRRRVFILGYQRGSELYNRISNNDSVNWILEDGILPKTFAVKKEDLDLEDGKVLKNFVLDNDVQKVSSEFNKVGKDSPFYNSGVMVNGQITTIKTEPNYDGTRLVLKNLILDENSQIPSEFFIPEVDLKKWEYLKGAKKEVRTTKEGFSYNYTEGGMIFPDDLESASRTIITGEGGKSPSRFKHVINTDNGYRRLTPIELERLNMFPDNHTHLDGISDEKRAFFMGNALVVGVIEKIGTTLLNEIRL